MNFIISNKYCRLARNLIVLAALALSIASARALTNNLALTPPMGWNSWNYFQCDGLNETVIRAAADVIASNGLKAAGYQFINLDDCWQVGRDTNEVVIPDPVKFSNGIKALANYVHADGLKFGLYSDHGYATCQGRPGGYGYEYLDANTYALWGVDYLKYDNCNWPANDNPQQDYTRMSDALMQCGHPIIFSLCYWSFASWEPRLGNLWRTTGDIANNYNSMVSIIDPNSKAAYVAGSGRWNDPDMLEIGNGGMTTTEDQTHFTMWCIMAAPLIMGNNILDMSPQTLAILTNSEAIAVDQDPAGEQGVKMVNNAVSSSTTEVWSKTLGYDFNTKAVVLFNRNGPATNITCNWTNLGLQVGAATVRDLWAHKDLGTFTNGFTTNVPSHAAVMLKVVGTPPPVPSLGTTYLSDLQPIYSYVGWGTMNKDKSIGGNSIKLGGLTYTKGLGVHAFSGLEYNLGGVASRFQAVIGVDSESAGTSASIGFQVYADGVLIFDSGLMFAGTAPKPIDLDVHGVSRLVLGVNDADDGNGYDHADWANALIIVTNTTPATPRPPTGLAAVSRAGIVLSWNPSLSATGYIIERSSDGGNTFITLGTFPVAEFTDTNIDIGASYYYVVSATNRFGASGNSTGVSVVSCLPPATPANVVVSGLAISNVVLTWTAVPDAASYSVARALRNTPFQVIATGLTGTNYTDAQTPENQVYYYTVTAVNECGQSAPSPFVAADVPVPPFVSAPGKRIGIHFAGTSGGTISAMSYSDVAGVAPQKNWNNVDLSQGSSGGLSQIIGPNPGVISDNSGQPTGMTFSYSAQGMWSVDQQTHTGNQQLLDGYADITTSSNGSCVLGNIPFSVYDVYVYVTSDANGRPASADINGGQQVFLQTDAATFNFANPLIRATSTNQESAVGAHYVAFPQVTGSNLQIDLNWLGEHVGLAAVQIAPSALWMTNAWNGTNWSLTWPVAANGKLLQSTNLNGPWTTNVGIMPPLQVSPTKPQIFYRVQY